MAVKHNNSTQVFEDISAASTLSVIFGYITAHQMHTHRNRRELFSYKKSSFFISHMVGR